eukprot:GHVT01096755.1.p1 GENE.GHVT01096755.1~~GHVT01096755.1.p1  ORF type:complete len:438 (+),score=63.41 GHVT01096755.1:3037-4350(+)
MPKVGRERKTTRGVRHNPLGAPVDRSRQLLAEVEESSVVEQSIEDATDGGILPKKLGRRLLAVVEEQEEEERQLDKRASAGLSAHAATSNEDAPGGDEAGVAGDAIDEGGSLENFLAPGNLNPARRTLADIVMEKLREAETKRLQSVADEPNAPPGASTSGQDEGGLSDRIRSVYVQLGEFLASYKAGRLPKAFKIIPRLKDWEEVLLLTNPINWTANAMAEATRIFASNLNPAMAQRFYSLVLLPAVREDIAANRKLNFHYYQALKKALFKPAAWFKAILLPLAEDGCTLREASIIGSVLSRVSVPALHSAAALRRLAALQPWYGTTSYFISILICKKYAMPVSVVGDLVKHFYSFVDDDRELPVVWHKSLLFFVQTYKNELSSDSRSQLKSLLQHHFHHSIGPVIRRELFATTPQQMLSAAEQAHQAGDNYPRLI